MDTAPRAARVVDGYDLDAEGERLGSIPDAVVLGRRLNRGTATVSVTAGGDPPHHEAVRAAHRAALFPNTVDDDAPVVELGWPIAGPFVLSSTGTYLDLYLGVAQKLFDPNHPRLREAEDLLHGLGLLTRREINTDDYLATAPHVEGLRTPQDLASLASGLAARAFPGTGPWKAFLSNSGTEAVEAALKIAWQTRHKRFLAEHGFAVLERVARDLDIGRMTALDAETSLPDPLLEDYPFFIVGCWGGFHGRTLGSLHFTTSKKAQRAGYPQTRWARRIPFNGNPGDLDALIDPRPLTEVLAAPGGVRGVIAAGRIPRDLFAGFLAEPLQGEGGYRPADPAWLRATAGATQRHGGLVIMDEVQTVGRTGTLFFAEQYGIRPDVVATAKGVVVGLTLARADLGRHLHQGWHANTWGGGKILDNQWAWTVLDALVHHRDPVLGGLSYFENTRVKGRYLAERLEALRERHPEILTEVTQRGLMVGLSVRRRADVVRTGWRRGLKLLGCGPAGEVSRLRLVFLVDTLAREIDETVRVLDAVFGEVAKA